LIEDTFVIDAVAHSFNTATDNFMDDGKMARTLVDGFYNLFHVPFSPRNDPQWTLSPEIYYAGDNADLLAHALFAESQTDACIYHEVPMFGIFKDGLSPISVGRVLREQYPGRVLIYGGVSPWQKDPIGTIDRLVEEDHVTGLKLYPMDLYDGRMQNYRMDNPEVAYPIYQRALEHGIKSVAIHKALPLGPVSTDPFRPSDIEGAAAAFPDLHFEIVHGGLAFLEETASMVARFPNILINLEATSGFLVDRPRRFAEIAGNLIDNGGVDRLIWATGCMVLHPQPPLEAFWNFEMPRDLVEDYGLPEITREIKQGILGGNIARILGLDTDGMQRESANDDFAQRSELAPPWSGAAVPS
jgi:predicted TIM-barrel fold metal-dependent hydrolase